MKLVFLGTSYFAVPVLKFLAEGRHEVVGVITQPDRPCGRGKRMACSPVKIIAQELGFPVWQPEKINSPDFLKFLAEISPDALVVAAYGQILRLPLLNLAPLGCINLHASLLPAYRGADPIRWALLKGEKETGVTVMRMDEGVDTGPIFAMKKVEIHFSDDCKILTERLSSVGGPLLEDTLSRLENGTIKPKLQRNEGVSMAPRISREMTRINWSESANQIMNRIRALSPTPGAFALLRGKRVQIFRASLWEDDGVDEEMKKGEPGTIIGVEKEQGIVVKTGKCTALVLHKLRPENRKTLYHKEFCCGYRIKRGETFE